MAGHNWSPLSAPGPPRGAPWRPRSAAGTPPPAQRPLPPFAVFWGGGAGGVQAPQPLPRAPERTCPACPCPSGTGRVCSLESPARREPPNPTDAESESLKTKVGPKAKKSRALLWEAREVSGEGGPLPGRGSPRAAAQATYVEGARIPGGSDLPPPVSIILYISRRYTYKQVEILHPTAPFYT